MRDVYLRTGGAISRYAAAQERDPRGHITIFDLDPSAKSRSLPTPMRKTVLGCDRNELTSPLIQGRVISHERHHPGANAQAVSQRRQMSQRPSPVHGCSAT